MKIEFYNILLAALQSNLNTLGSFKNTHSIEFLWLYSVYSVENIFSKNNKINSKTNITKYYPIFKLD